MKLQLLKVLVLGTSLALLGIRGIEASSHAERAKTDAGRVDIPPKEHIKYGGIYHQIKNMNLESREIDLENGSRWNVARSDAIKGWEKSKNLVLTQNHAVFSSSRYALLNLDLKLAEPISLLREPIPNKSDFITSVDRVNDTVTLSDNKKWIVHSADRDKLIKINENDRVVIGINTGSDQDKSPYLLIDTANNHFVRAHIIE